MVNILNIWRKELTDSLRDRKALQQSLFVPLVIGILYAVMNPLLNSMITQRAQDPLTIPTAGIEYAGEDFVNLLAEFDITLEAYTGDLEKMIADGETAAGLIIPPDFDDSIAAEESASLTLLTNPTTGGLFGGSFSVERLDLAISSYNQAVSITRLQARDLDSTLLTPIRLETNNLASPEQRAGVFASFMLPLLVVIIVAQGGLFIAIDVTAGEKERGTLEALLVTPTTDLEVFTGKLMAVFTLSVGPFVLSLIGFWLAGSLLPESINQTGTLPITVILVAILVGIPLALLMAVILMAVSVRTKTFKDAQSAAAPLTMASLIPAFAAAIVSPGSHLAYLIPMYGPAALVGQTAISGGSVDIVAMLVSIIGSLIGATIAFVLAFRLFNRERLLYSA